jgi:hypothetical protein
MSRADKRLRPEPHACCPVASLFLTTVSFCGAWSWRVNGTRLHVMHCPWCGVQLPRTASPGRLRLVR